MSLFIVFAAVTVIVGKLYYDHFSEGQETRRAIMAASYVPIAEASAGAVAKIVGRVSYLTEPLTAPLSGRRCAYYRVVVEEYRSSTSAWVAIIRETDGVDFLVDDGTGQARVHNRRLKALAIEDVRYTSGALNDAAPRLEAFLAKHGEKSTAWSFNRSMRYVEAIFEAGETLAVVGQVGFELDPEAQGPSSGYRTVPRRAVISAPEGGHVLASDDPEVLEVWEPVRRTGVRHRA